jgi:solute carrier family 25 (mitochondrial phosphate transporter), member 3
MTPIDVVKTRIQLEPKGSKPNMVTMARNIMASEGPAGLMTGFGATATGYLVQGGESRLLILALSSRTGC